MTILHQLSELGQAIWLDYIRRAFITSGELAQLVDQGLRGLTSNPIIFDKAITGSSDYDAELHALVDQDKSVKQIYEALVIKDIRLAADALESVFKETNGGDGYVSLEVSPTLAHDTQGTIEEARSLHKALARPNIMIKVPATHAGLGAIETLIAEGISVNATLIFSLSHYRGVAEAYISGLEKFAAAGGDLNKVASVASFFISRIDVAVDKQLKEIGDETLLGKIAIANAKNAYKMLMELKARSEWKALAKKGAQTQRLLWASTSTKDPAYPDTMYVDELIGGETVNTVPPATLRAFFDHGVAQPTLEPGLEDALDQLQQLNDLGIDLEAITEKLQEDGIQSFAKAFEGIMSSLAAKREQLLAGWHHFQASLGSYQTLADDALADISENRILSRIWEHDFTVWKPDADEISNRLGWLHSPELMRANVDRLQAFAKSVQASGYTDVVLLGMGGSSLAPEVFRNTFGIAPNGLDLFVLDTTDPAAILTRTKELTYEKTLFIVATKSGGTVETLSLFRYFYNLVLEKVGSENVGEHFVGITDPGSKLAELSKTYNFRELFLNDPNIGGRYSALSYFGLAPAALLGLDINLLLDRALAASVGCESCVEESKNPGVFLGAIIGALANQGRDKLTLITSPALASFGDWIEQLIAESTGKEGKGILPVVGESVGVPGDYGGDRLFCYLRLDGDSTHDQAIEDLEEAGYPVLQFKLHDIYDLGGQFFIWELATAIAAQRLKVNPFDQPNVEAAKILARQKVAELEARGSFPTLSPTLESDGIAIFSNGNSGAEVASGNSPKEVFNSFLTPKDSPSYVALQAYVQPTEHTERALQKFRDAIRAETGLAVSMGFGPRFLHSTGQLHKGDAGKGLFIQITSDDKADLPIPTEAGADTSKLTFGQLKAASADGDRQALMEGGRRVIRIHLQEPLLPQLEKIARWLS